MRKPSTVRHLIPVAACLSWALCSCVVVPEPVAPVPEPDPRRYASAFTAVTTDGASAPMALAVHACVGLMNRELGGSAIVLGESHDAQWLDTLGLSPAETVDAETFLHRCHTQFPDCVRYDYTTQQALLPPILSAASALDAVPLALGLPVECSDPELDAIDALADHDTPQLATEWAAEHFLSMSTGLAMLNPGYQIDADDLSAPPLNRDMPPTMVDFVFSQRLFVVFLVNGCDEEDPENSALQAVVDGGPWPHPIGVYGYNNSWLIGGYLHEAQTRCLPSRNMGAVPTETPNLSFWSTRRPAISERGQLLQNPRESLEWDPEKTYLSFVVGDGDNVRFILSTRNQWLQQRIDDCERPESRCAPLSWSLSPHLPWLAPDVIEWYYAQARSTGHDYFVLPPSGHLYAYPTSLNAEDQDRFVAATEDDAALLDVSGTVHWDWFDTWEDATAGMLPKYASGGVIRGLFPVNVPFIIEAFPDWPEDRFFTVLERDGGAVALFRPRQWRGVHDDGDRFFYSPERMAEEIAAYPRGTITSIYMTSDGGLSLENAFLALQPLLPPHVELVSADTAARLALSVPR